MKKIISFFYVLLLFCNTVYSQWTDYNFSNNLSFCRDIQFIDAHTGFIIGDYEDPNTSNDYIRIYRTTNSGNSWSKVFEKLSVAGSPYSLSSVYFSSPLNGFAVGGQSSFLYICKTTDGGATWTDAQYLNWPFNASSVFFSSANVGYVAGSIYVQPSAIVKTTDGGVNWSDISQNAATVMGGNGISAISFIDDNNGFAVTVADNGGTQAGIYKTTDGGTTWTQKFQHTNDHSFTSVRFINATTGFVSDSYSNVYKTTDGGNSWTATTLPITHEIFDIYFFTSQLGYAASGDAGQGGYYGGIYKTTNGGTTWTLENDGSPYVYLDYSALSFAVGTGYACGVQGYSKLINAPMAINETPQTFTDLVIYPNPSMGNYKVELENPTKVCVVEVYDMIGNLVLKNQYNDMQTIEFDLTLQPTGMYYLKLTTDNRDVITSKITKN